MVLAKPLCLCIDLMRNHEEILFSGCDLSVVSHRYTVFLVLFIKECVLNIFLLFVQLLEKDSITKIFTCRLLVLFRKECFAQYFSSLCSTSRTPSEKYSPIDWMGFFDREDDIKIADSESVFHVYTAGTEGPVVFCLHGGGYSGLSFALSTSKIKEKARVVAMDLRGHGKSFTENDLDLSVETLCNDVLAILKAMYGDSAPAIVMVGHSMGGSVAVHVAATKAVPSLAGLVVVDVVEGTAMASLIHMQKILSNRMQHFSTIEKAIEWSIKGGSLRNIDSARVSIPSTLTYDDSRKCHTHRARLEETEQYWRGWYEGLSEKFLSCPVPKLLLLAGTDRLDRTLTIGQMQGKFQMVVVRHTGHAIQEDVPDEFANLVVNFISRNRIGPHGVEIPGIRRPSLPMP